MLKCGMFKDCTAIILAGGLGTRLKAVVADRPKVMAPVNGRPFLTILLEQLFLARCQKVVLCTGYRGGFIRKKLGRRYKNIALFYSREKKPLGTAGALRRALPFIKTGSVLIMNGDSYCGASLDDFYLNFKQRGAKPHMLLTRISDARRYGKAVLDRDGRILRFLEKDPRQSSGWINAGLYLMTRESLKAIPARRMVSLEKEVFPQWVQSGFYGHRVRAPFLDIGTVQSYNGAGRFFAKK